MIDHHLTEVISPGENDFTVIPSFNIHVHMKCGWVLAKIDLLQAHTELMYILQVFKLRLSQFLISYSSFLLSF